MISQLCPLQVVITAIRVAKIHHVHLYVLGEFTKQEINEFVVSHEISLTSMVFQFGYCFLA